MVSNAGSKVTTGSRGSAGPDPSKYSLVYCNITVMLDALR